MDCGSNATALAYDDFELLQRHRPERHVVKAKAVAPSEADSATALHKRRRLRSFCASNPLDCGSNTKAF